MINVKKVTQAKMINNPNNWCPNNLNPNPQNAPAFVSNNADNTIPINPDPY